MNEISLLPLAGLGGVYEDAVGDGDLPCQWSKRPRQTDGSRRGGLLGAEATLLEGMEDAHWTELDRPAVLEQELNSLDRARRTVKLSGVANGASKYAGSSKVIDGCSLLLIDVVDDRGRHPGPAVGMDCLPGDTPVEIAMIARAVP